MEIPHALTWLIHLGSAGPIVYIVKPPEGKHHAYGRDDIYYCKEIAIWLHVTHLGFYTLDMCTLSRGGCSGRFNIWTPFQESLMGTFKQTLKQISCGKMFRS